MRSPSIKNIAEKLGVSIATVSMVLSEKPVGGRVSEKLADKIKQTAKEMNYRPNSLARSLRIGRSKTIGLIVADISNLFFGSLAFHIQEEAEKYGYSVIITNTNESIRKLKLEIDLFRIRRVDGFIIVPTEDSSEHIQNLIDDKVPIVLVDRYFPFVPSNYVIIDNYKASLDAVNLLIKRGCKNVALITYENKLSHIMERRNGYVDALTYAGVPDNINIKEVRYLNIADDVDNAIKELLGNERKIDGIFFATNSISLNGIRSLKKRGVDIAKGLDIVCFDRNDAFELLPVPIPYVQQPIPEIAKKAVEILIGDIKNPKGEKMDAQGLKLSARLHV